MEQPHIGRLPVPGAPIKASGVDADLGDPSPDWGAHTRPVLRELLGIGATDLERLERDGRHWRTRAPYAMTSRSARTERIGS